MPTGEFWSVTTTATELSIVCPAGSEPTGAEVVGPWRVLSVDGPLDFALVGILESLLAPLAAAEISVFTVSTFDTDHLLVRAEDLERTIACLRSAGHTVVSARSRAAAAASTCSTVRPQHPPSAVAPREIQSTK